MSALMTVSLSFYEQEVVKAFHAIGWSRLASARSLRPPAYRRISGARLCSQSTDALYVLV
jgi:predicted dinucleotide-binding enzyme